MSENKHEPDEAREHEPRTEDVPTDHVQTDGVGTEEVRETSGTVDDTEITEVIQDGPVPGSPDKSVPEPARSVPKTERIEIARTGPLDPDDMSATPDDASTVPDGQDDAPARTATPPVEPPVVPAAGAQPVAEEISREQPAPAGAPTGQAPYAGSDTAVQSAPADAHGAPAATAIQTVRQPHPAAQPAPPQGPRVGTVVWGLVVLAIGLGMLAAAAGANIDVSLAAILLLGGAGVALVAGSIVSSFRRRGEQ